MAEQIPIFVVSLKNAIERRESIERQMERWGLEFSFFDAVDGRDKEVLEVHRDLIDKEWNKKRSGDSLKPEEIGCALSHAFCYKRIIDSGVRDAIILEDDAVLSGDFCHFARRIWKASPEVQLLILHAYRSQYVVKGSELELLGSGKKYHTYKPYMSFFGACGYYLKQEAAVKLYRAALPVWTTSDWPMDISKALGARGLEPPLVDQSARFDSQIQDYANRKIPFVIIIMRLLLFPTFINARLFGSPWKSLYAWRAVKRRFLVAIFARRPVR
ncbi:glycosyltransferase family 25 protein [Halomonas sp. NO4]|uniref:glycosyltransferase family 25 protein n=1 Tax=Halomonas sp. NO4 TaxID=2484813 RepID=UPI0013D41912|nr:glycosyltransferase family 25 protein [Halomonas sp. NO4]